MLKCKKCKKIYKTLHDIKTKNLKYNFKTKQVHYYCDCGQDLGEFH